MLHHVEGIVIRTMDYKEADRIVTIYARELGKISFVAKGVRKVKSRYGAACQLFTYGQFSIYLTRQLGTLRHAEISNSFHTLRVDLDLIAYAGYLTELLDLMTLERTPDESLFASYLAGLVALEERRTARIIIHIFELKMLQESGYAPQFRTCVLCAANQSEKPFVLSPKAGGVVCDRCLHHDPAARIISQTARRLLSTMQQMDIEQLGTVDLKAETMHELHRLLRDFINYHIEHRWKARTFLDEWLDLQ